MSRLRRSLRKGTKGALLKNRKGTTLRQDLGKGAADIKTSFKKIKDAGKSLTRGTKDLTATRFGVIQGPAAGSDLLVAARKIASKKGDAPKFVKKDNELSPYQKAVQERNEQRLQLKKDKIIAKIKENKAKQGPQNTDYKNQTIQVAIDRLEKQLAKLK